MFKNTVAAVGFFAGVSVVAVMLSGCSSTGTVEGGEKLFTVPSAAPNGVIVSDTSGGVPSASPVVEQDQAVVEAEEVAKLVAGVDAVLQDKPVIDPKDTVEVQQAKANELFKKQDSMYSGNVGVDGNGSYRVVSPDVMGVGPSKPLQIAVVPDGVGQGDVRLYPPVLIYTPSVGADGDLVAVGADGSGKGVEVSCTPEIFPVAPRIVTCSFSDEVPDNAVLQFGFLVRDTKAELVSITLNKSVMP